MVRNKVVFLGLFANIAMGILFGASVERHDIWGMIVFGLCVLFASYSNYRLICALEEYFETVSALIDNMERDMREKGIIE